MAKRGRYNKQGPLKGSYYHYTLSDQAQNFTLSEARAEYARLRREANRRLEVLGRSEYKNASAYKNWSEGFEALPKNAPERDVRRELADVARFLHLKTSSLEGAKRAQKAFVEKMQENGYEWINERNAAAFGRYMGAVQKDKASKGYDSEQVAELFHKAKQKRIDTNTLAKDFEFWLKHEDELDNAPRAQSTTSSADFAAGIGLSID